ncbi:hypothetical protein Sru01_67360 [Sphaerisporangium rufum]|uniref:Uncharacterized protein n=1 Tax=Sphaerisporangium rufum TaxID=1381558 RepID=A0A919R988_9ACTN|nr:hypothetical protein [Sphaerisporangium rufum]GII81754.1 hypothetical protein Sru01_67360 [Sphaerisporangium rufum]
MTLPAVEKTTHLRRARLLGIVLAALIAGGFIGSYLPIGTVPLRVVEGQAWMMADGEKGSFQADDGLSAGFHDDVVWSRAGGTVTVGGRPSCLWNHETRTPLDRATRVEAGYRWIKTPDGVSYPVVVWLRCLDP